MRRYITSLIVRKPKLRCLWIECLCVGQQNLNRGCYVSYFATFIFVTISCSFHNFFMGRVYHTKTFDFRMWKNYLVITLSMSVGLWEYCAIRSLLQNLVYCFYRSMVLYCHCHCHIPRVSVVFRRNRKGKLNWNWLRSSGFYST